MNVLMNYIYSDELHTQVNKTIAQKDEAKKKTTNSRHFWAHKHTLKWKKTACVLNITGFMTDIAPGSFIAFPSIIKICSSFGRSWFITLGKQMS